MGNTSHMFLSILTGAGMILGNKTPFIVPQGIEILKPHAAQCSGFYECKQVAAWLEVKLIVYKNSITCTSNIAIWYFCCCMHNVLLSKGSLINTLFLDQSTEGKT